MKKTTITINLVTKEVVVVVEESESKFEDKAAGFERVGSKWF